MTNQTTDLYRYKHPSENWKYRLAITCALLILPLIIVVLFKGGIAAVIGLLGYFLGGSSIFRAVLNKNSIKLTERNFPEYFQIINKIKSQFNCKQNIEIFITDKKVPRLSYFPLFYNKCIILNEKLISGQYNEEETKWILNRSISGLVLRGIRFEVLEEILNKMEQLSVFNLLFYPYERTAQLSADQLALSSGDVPLKAAITALHKFMIGEEIGGKAHLVETLRQDKKSWGQLGAWLATCMSRQPHLSSRIENLLKFAARKMPDHFETYMSEFNEEDQRYIRYLVSISNPHKAD